MPGSPYQWGLNQGSVEGKAAKQCSTTQACLERTRCVPLHLASTQLLIQVTMPRRGGREREREGERERERERVEKQ